MVGCLSLSSGPEAQPDGGNLIMCNFAQFADTAQCIINAVIVCPYNRALTGGNMKNVIFATIALAVICTAGTVAQGQSQGWQDPQATSNHIRKTTVKGYVRKDGDNYVVEDDKDKTRYRVQNTELVREHEGHHVVVNARLHEDDHSLEVTKVKMLKDEHPDH
jgi:hypothetical protein